MLFLPGNFFISSSSSIHRALPTFDKAWRTKNYNSTLVLKLIWLFECHFNDCFIVQSGDVCRFRIQGLSIELRFGLDSMPNQYQLGNGLVLLDYSLERALALDNDYLKVDVQGQNHLPGLEGEFSQKQHLNKLSSSIPRNHLRTVKNFISLIKKSQF